jgi:hypothetical protein
MAQCCPRSLRGLPYHIGTRPYRPPHSQQIAHEGLEILVIITVKSLRTSCEGRTRAHNEYRACECHKTGPCQPKAEPIAPTKKTTIGETWGRWRVLVHVHACVVA